MKCLKDADFRNSINTPSCRAKTKDFYYVCTRKKGHKGKHRAHGCYGECYAVWGDDYAVWGDD